MTGEELLELARLRYMQDVEEWRSCEMERMRDVRPSIQAVTTEGTTKQVEGGHTQPKTSA